MVEASGGSCGIGDISAIYSQDAKGQVLTASSDVIALTPDGLLVFFLSLLSQRLVFVSILRLTYHQEMNVLHMRFSRYSAQQDFLAVSRFRLYLTFNVSSRNECFTYAVFKVHCTIKSKRHLECSHSGMAFCILLYRVPACD